MKDFKNILFKTGYAVVYIGILTIFTWVMIKGFYLIKSFFA